MTRLPIETVTAQAVAVPYVVIRHIARGTETEARVVQVELTAGGQTGRGEAHPTLRYHETDDTIFAAVETARPHLQAGCTREDLLALMKPGPARNAVDCAFWDLEAKLAGKTAEEIAGCAPVHTVTTVYTISIMSPAEMIELAVKERDRPFLKIKLGHFADDRARLEGIRRAAPNAKLIVDANEGWSFDELKVMAKVAEDCGVLMLEQPMHASRDEALRGFDCPIPIGADESVHTRADLDRVADRGYAFVNIKLDKSGGLTEALALAEAAKARGFGLMVGCMSGTTLAMAPGFLVAQGCHFVDLDSPIYLPPEASPEIAYDGSIVSWAPTRNWGKPG
jgi:L-alanine-DL-glutamate epimerase-like enolase superfamily enzyme